MFVENKSNPGSQKIRFLVRAAIIAALYAATTLLVVATPLASLSFGPVQFRISEALTILPAISTAAVPGLAVGCLVANLVGITAGLGGGWLDIVFGTLATLLAAWLSSRMKKDVLVPLPPVLINAVVVGWVLSYTLQLPYWPTMLSVGAGQLVVCYALGFPLLKLLRKHKSHLF